MGRIGFPETVVILAMSSWCSAQRGSPTWRAVLARRFVASRSRSAKARTRRRQSRRCRMTAKRSSSLQLVLSLGRVEHVGQMRRMGPCAAHWSCWDCPAPAAASLGGDLSSVQTDQVRIQGAVMRVTSSDTFTVHEMRAATGTTIREYVSPSGKVFGVAWDGPTLPDLRQVLGVYFAPYLQAAQAAQKKRARPRPAFESKSPPSSWSRAGIRELLPGRAYVAAIRAGGQSARKSFDRRNRWRSNSSPWPVLGTVVVNPECGTTPPSTNVIATPTQNVQPITVNAGPANNYANGLFTSVTICVPGSTANCQTIDGVLVDTGSSGLRILSSALTLTLPQQTVEWQSGGRMQSVRRWLYLGARCRLADIAMAGERAGARADPGDRRAGVLDDSRQLHECRAVRKHPRYARRKRRAGDRLVPAGLRTRLCGGRRIEPGTVLHVFDIGLPDDG